MSFPSKSGPRPDTSTALSSTFKLCKDCTHFGPIDDERAPRCQRPVPSLVYGTRELNRMAWQERGEFRTLSGRAPDGSECGKEAQYFAPLKVTL